MAVLDSLQSPVLVEARCLFLLPGPSCWMVFGGGYFPGEPKRPQTLREKPTIFGGFLEATKMSKELVRGVVRSKKEQGVGEGGWSEAKKSKELMRGGRK